MAKSSEALFPFLVPICILTISEFATVKGELCEKPSKTWSGNCGNTRHCDDQCKSWEGAVHGACHVRDKKHMCFCYFNCQTAEKPAQDKLKLKSSHETILKLKKYHILNNQLDPSMILE